MVLNYIVILTTDETLFRIMGCVNLESSRGQNMLVSTYKTLYGIAPPSSEITTGRKKRRAISEVP